MMCAVTGFITLGFWIGRRSRVLHPHHHSLHHGTIVFLHLFGVLSNSAPKLREPRRIFWLERQSRTVLNILVCDRERHHVPVHAVVGVHLRHTLYAYGTLTSGARNHAQPWALAS